MNKKLICTLFVICVIIYVEGKKTSRSRSSSSSGRGSSRKTNNPQPSPTSLSYPQSSAAKPSLSGWQENPAQKSASTWQSKTQSGQSHSYPSSQTGLSGSKSQPSQTGQGSVQRSNVPQSQSQPAQTHGQSGHAYPSSNGLSGNSGPGYPQGTGLSGSAAAHPPSPGAGYPQNSGLSGTGSQVGNTGVGYPQGSSVGSGYPHNSGTQGHGYSGVAPPPYSGNRPYNGNQQPQNYGNNYHHPQPPPPYPNYGSNHGGYGGQGYNPGPQTPGFFGNYGNKGYGGVSRTSSALKGVGIAGVGVGTLLTGLALWNLARSTGNRHHTVIYDNRGQPVAVQAANDTSSSDTDSFLGDLVNCSLTISGENSTEVLAIPCAIASSFSPDADVKEITGPDGKVDTTKCKVTVITKTGKEYMTTIPCATLLNTAAENNVTEPVLPENTTENVDTVPNSGAPDNMPQPNQPSALSLTSEKTSSNPTDSGLNCTSEPGDQRDPINPCFSVTSDLTVIPLQTTDKPEVPTK